MKKQWLALLLSGLMILTLAACKGGPEGPVAGGDWRVRQGYVGKPMRLNGETADCLVGVQNNLLAVYYDKEEQTLIGTTDDTVLFADIDKSLATVRFEERNGDTTDELVVSEEQTDGSVFDIVFVYDGTEYFVYSVTLSGPAKD